MKGSGTVTKRSFWGSGEPFVWLSGAALAACLLMVAAMLGLILLNGAGYFWPTAVVHLQLSDGAVRIGEIAAADVVDGEKKLKLKRGNRDLNGSDFVWLDQNSIGVTTYPGELYTIERREWGNFYGSVVGLVGADAAQESAVAVSPEALQDAVTSATKHFDEIRRIERDIIGDINYQQEQIRLQLKGLERTGEANPKVREDLVREQSLLTSRYTEAEAKLDALKAQPQRQLLVESDTKEQLRIPLSQIVRLYQPNTLPMWQKVGIYLAKFWEFVSEDPRESNTEGGVFPAIFGTVMMVFIMSIVVTPLGVLAAVYLREYARQGRWVSLVRIAVNNLAGVPSIVFGVFGVGFFIYTVGGSIDALFYPDNLPTPTYGTGGILWASLTLALLTVPTVIVATEEGLASIPKSLREGSYALGATKFETTWRVVLPALAPSILTGMILAVARAAGEVAPLMVTGVVKLAPALPLDGNWPYFHFDRKFMHLGFHIYDVGFQSPNVDAARPMVFTTTLLLLFIVVALNLSALILRNRLRRRFMVSAV